MKSAQYVQCFSQKEKILTDITTLDKSLRGGISLKKVTELTCTPGSDKSLMCLQLCLNVQIPKLFGGLGGKALYLDTQRNFDPSSLQKLAIDLERRLAERGFLLKATGMLKDVYFIDCPTTAQLMASIINCQEYLKAQPHIKLIIINSLSFPIRMEEHVFDRTALLMEIHDIIHKLTFKHDVTFVVGNELRFHPLGRRFAVEPVLGQKHTTLINERIWFINNEIFIGKIYKTKKYIGKVST